MLQQVHPVAHHQKAQPQKVRPQKVRPAAPPHLARWVALCAAAEAIGITAAATAAKTSQALVGEPSGRSEVTLALSLVVAGGLVEGVALGVAQSRGLSDWLPRSHRNGWLLATLAVAGLGWAAASAPGVLSGTGDGTEPDLLLVLAGAVGIGAVMGAVLGGVQALVLRGQVPHPGCWVSANVLAWAVAMPVIFLGATTPAADWSTPAVVALGALTGLCAGSALGVVSGWFLPSLTGQSPHNRVVLALLASPAHRVLDQSLVGLRVRGRLSGAEFTFPVMYAADEAGLVVVPGDHLRKRWWRNLCPAAPASVLINGHWRSATGEVLTPIDDGYDEARLCYNDRWPRVPDSMGPVVRVRLSAPEA